MMTMPQTPSLAMQIDLPGYALGITILLLVMLVHGVALLQIAKRYEVKSFLYLSEHQHSSVAFVFTSAFCVYF